jgi:hypothetical protein
LPKTSDRRQQADRQAVEEEPAAVACDQRLDGDGLAAADARADDRDERRDVDHQQPEAGEHQAGEQCDDDRQQDVGQLALETGDEFFTDQRRPQRGVPF